MSSTPVQPAAGRLSGKTAVITGASTGLGFDTARRFIAEGARVVITGVNEQRLADAVAALGPSATGVRADVRDPGQLRALADQVKELFGRLDILVANAGIARFAPLEQVDEADFDDQFNTNVKGVLFSVQALLPLLGAGGSIVLTASAVHGKGFPGGTVYSATKAAVRSLGRTLAAELAPRRIRVNVVSPGFVPTAIQAKMGLPQDALAGLEAGIVQTTPLARVGRPEEVASAILFLASDESSYTTGADLAVEGGLTAV